MATATFPEIFTEARTYPRFRAEPVSDELLRAVWDASRFGPTAMNSGPLRVAFVRSPDAKERLVACAAAGNVDKIKSAPVTAILAFDTDFHEKLPKLYPHAGAAIERFRAQTAEERSGVAKSNAWLGAAYFIVAARGYGLDCGPMGGFDATKVDAAFFAGKTLRSFLLVNLGYGDPASLHPRNERLSFDEACELV